MSPQQEKAMAPLKPDSRSAIFPFMRYKDAPAAIAWLGKAFGFTEHAVYPGPDGTIAHAELALGAGIIMLGSMKDDAFGMKSPRDLGGVNQRLYDTDALYERAKAAGAEIVRELADTDYGSRDFMCRDLEGHLWSFGTYLPEAPKE
jgi:uncharacterized glyoxalase superfamily protein PhnB